MPQPNCFCVGLMSNVFRDKGKKMRDYFTAAAAYPQH